MSKQIIFEMLKFLSNEYKNIICYLRKSNLDLLNLSINYNKKLDFFYSI